LFYSITPPLFIFLIESSQITLWLLDLHAPLHRYVRRDPDNPWFSIDIERAMIERNIAYRVLRRRKTTLDRERY
jgi:hypothetical protein